MYIKPQTGTGCWRCTGYVTEQRGAQCLTVEIAEDTNYPTGLSVHKSGLTSKRLRPGTSTRIAPI